jgi:hypothetical protein
LAARLAVTVGDGAATVWGAASVVVRVTRSSGGVKKRRLAGDRRRHRQARPTLSRPNAAALFQDTCAGRASSRRGRGAATAGWDLAGGAERSRFDWVRG